MPCQGVCLRQSPVGYWPGPACRAAISLRSSGCPQQLWLWDLFAAEVGHQLCTSSLAPTVGRKSRWILQTRASSGSSPCAGTAFGRFVVHEHASGRSLGSPGSAAASEELKPASGCSLFVCPVQLKVQASEAMRLSSGVLLILDKEGTPSKRIWPRAKSQILVACSTARGIS